MKALLFLLVLWPLLGIAQKSMTFQEAQKAGIFERLDQRYKGGLNQDSTKAVFKNQSVYSRAYQEFLFGFGSFLKTQGFRWGRRVRCFNKIYFSRQGKVDYFLYSLTPGAITQEQEAQFAKLLSEYIQTARFKLPAPSRFSQCSPVNYGDL